jgi:hypothetical protein
MLDALYRILSGSPLTKKQMSLAGIFVLFWFMIDFVEWVDWLMLKINPPFATMCLPLEMMPEPRIIDKFPPMPSIPAPYIDNGPFRIDRDR